MSEAEESNPADPTFFDAPVPTRLLAKAIDFLVIIALSFVVLPYFIGPLLGLLYALFADGLPIQALHGGQSLGKWLMKLQVLNQKANRPGRWKDSLIRNGLVGVVVFFLLIPIWGWLIASLIGLPLLAIEVYLIFHLDSHERLGDVMADTRVVIVNPASEA